jgi:hypothetical protein
MTDKFYRFPANGKAKEATLEQQARKVCEEAGEVLFAVRRAEGVDHLLEETLDTIHACEGILRRYPMRRVLVAHARVLVKCMLRGDYSGGKR